jgi:hypothetical protein
MDHAVLLAARAAILSDLRSRGLDDVAAVSALEDSMSQRQWWAEQWPEGLPFVAGLVAQDVQDALLDAGRRWPECRACPEEAPLHTLSIQPDLGGPDPVWVCEEAGAVVDPLGELG